MSSSSSAEDTQDLDSDDNYNSLDYNDNSHYSAFDSDDGDGADEDMSHGHLGGGGDTTKNKTGLLETSIFSCLTVEEVEKLLNELVELLSTQIKVAPSLAKLLLHSMGWSPTEIAKSYEADANEVLIAAKISPKKSVEAASYQLLQCSISKSDVVIDISADCPVCDQNYTMDSLKALTCGHQFCKGCWNTLFAIQIVEGVSTGLQCMAHDCNVLAPEDFVLDLLTRPVLREKYQRFTFRDFVSSHPELRFCPGENCDIIVRSRGLKAKRIVCRQCESCFCFKCGKDYHAPASCDTIGLWLSKCADDGKFSLYIHTRTKECPKCHYCIEKGEGCNHMQCFNCKYQFCWMCLENWKSHEAQSYRCSTYIESRNTEKTSKPSSSTTREDLIKYVHYYERWENHSRSLKLEEQTLQKMKSRIEAKVMQSSGTWVDWQFLVDGANVLANCRHTLKYTYPYAFYMEGGLRKELFEYQQAQLEAEIEKLSWKLEKAESTDKGSLETQMSIAEKWRCTLLKEFLET